MIPDPRHLSGWPAGPLLIKAVVFVVGADEEEEFLVLTEHSADALELMKERRDRLQRGEPVRAQLDRQPQAFRASANAQHFELPPEFYNLSAEELKKEQQQRYRERFNNLCVWHHGLAV